MDLRKYINDFSGWHQYKAVNANAGVTRYFPGSDYILVVFKNQDMIAYIYDEEFVEKELVDEMKELAVKGKNLSSFINRRKEVKDHAEKMGIDLLENKKGGA